MSGRGTLVRAVSLSPASLRQLAYADPQAFPVLLDSSAAGPLGHFSILAAYPLGALWCERHGAVQASGTLRASAAAQTAPTGFLAALQAAWLQERDGEHARAAAGAAAAPPDGVPFRGGWLVFLGYEMAAEIEPQLDLPASAEPAADGPAALALRIPAAVAYDHRRGQGWLLAEEGHAERLIDLRRALDRVAAGAARPRADRPAAALRLSEEAPERFRARVAGALEYIRAGDIYQANLSRPWSGHCGLGATAALYERLRASNPAPFAALAQHGDWRLLCSSPERLVHVMHDRVQTRPIAGTRPRSLRDGYDALECAALVAHPKERAEHVMLIDLERNDLGRICRPGSVQVDEMMVTETYAHVHHIVSNVTGELRAGLTPLQVLRAVFPGGTITGCPKYRCMQVIAELEGEARGAYTGALGFINHDGSMDFNILIRSLTLGADRLQFRTGAGIVADSQWQRELAETRAKAQGLLAALGQSP